MTENTVSKFHSLETLQERVETFKKHDSFKYLSSIKRGIERETIRMDQEGNISGTSHPESLGSKLTHPYITTDYSESQPELVTGVHTSVTQLLTELSHIHFSLHEGISAHNESMWPFSMPPAIDKKQPPIFADFGQSPTGRLKSLYRLGLQERYGTALQLICGIHYNFSLSEDWWSARAEAVSALEGTTFTSTHKAITEGYLALGRNYLRNAWFVTWLFGASPNMDASYLDQLKMQTTQEVHLDDANFCINTATSLRTSVYGYSSSIQNEIIPIQMNSLDGYVQNINKGISTPHEKYKDQSGMLSQISNCVLQIPNEYYSPLRLKPATTSAMIPGLLDQGVGHIEIRNVDIDPFNVIGIDEDRVRILDLLLLMCTIDQSNELSDEEAQALLWHREQVALSGRLDKACTLRGYRILEKLRYLALILQEQTDEDWTSCLDVIEKAIDDPASNLPSARLAKAQQDGDLGFHELGAAAAKRNRDYWQNEFVPDYEALSKIVWHHNQSRKSAQYFKECTDAQFVQMLHNTSANMRWNIQ